MNFDKRFGIALISAFLLVPVIFIIVYIRTAPAENRQSQSAAEYDDANEPDDILLLQAEPVHTDEIDEDSEEQTIEVIGVAYLTFDDGPSLTVTPGILDILAQEDIKATFFSLPYSGADDIFLRIYNEGHEIGNHSYSHVYPTLYDGSVYSFREDIIRARRFFEDMLGYSSYSFRFPGGSGDQSRSTLNPRIEVLNELGYKYFDWDIDTNDWRQGRSAEDIEKDVLNNTNGREHVIILMHDVYERTLEALPLVIDGLRSQGCEFDVLKNYPN